MRRRRLEAEAKAKAMPRIRPRSVTQERLTQAQFALEVARLQQEAAELDWRIATEVISQLRMVNLALDACKARMKTRLAALRMRMVQRSEDDDDDDTEPSPLRRRYTQPTTINDDNDGDDNDDVQNRRR